MKKFLRPIIFRQKALVRIGILIWASAGSILPSQAYEMTWIEALQLSEQHSPALSAARQRQAQAEYSVGMVQAGYFPTLEWDEMDSSRFPESSETLGIGSLIGSPYRSGRVSAAVAKETLWDFGRTSNMVEGAKQNILFRKQDVQVIRYSVQQEALWAFFDCSRYRNQSENWKILGEQAQLVAKEINQFVRTGQRSVVDRMLADAQAEEAQVEEAGFASRWKDSLHRLSIWTGASENDLSCPLLPSDDQGVAISSSVFISPLVSRAMTESDMARLEVSRVKSDYWPKVVAAASAGRLDAVGIKEKSAYAFAGGVVFPLFDGLRTRNQVRRAEALVFEKDRELEAVQQRVADLNARYEETSHSSKARLMHLEHKLAAAESAFNLAKERYFSFQGEVSDLREALRNLAQTRAQIVDARTDLLKASGAQALLNGSLSEY